MIEQPHDYLFIDEIFYKKHTSEISEEFYISDLPKNYEILKEGVWKFYNNKNQVLPSQGWKIHISSDFNETNSVLKVVSNIAIESNVSFKHLIGPSEFLLSNSKNQNRATSGKYIVLYPSSESQFIKLLYRLDNKMKGFKKAAYILSDMRWKESNIYYRYGGFASIYDEEGNLCIEDEHGELIIDKRLPYYYVPKIAKDFNEYLNEINELPEENEENQLSRYIIKDALSFSNSGGVYLARRKSDNKKVIIKEARNNTGLDSMKRTGKNRLRIEKWAIKKLKDVKGVVNLLDYFKEWEHEFLVEEYVEGETLHSWIAKNYPFVSFDDLKYRKCVHVIIKELIKIIKGIHEKNIVMGDLQPHNIFVDDELNVKLIDFETASNAHIKPNIGLAVPVFSHMGIKKNTDRDWYALYKIIRFMLLPIYSTVETAEYLDNQHNHWIKKVYGDEFDEYLRYVKSKIESVNVNIKIDKGVKEVKSIDDFIDCCIHSIKKYSFDDEYLTPNIYKQFNNRGGKLNIESGAFGVLWSLGKFLKKDKLSFYKKWIRKNVNFNEIEKYDKGLFNGKCGIVSTLYSYGFKEKAIELEKSIEINSVVKQRDLSLYSGQSGIGLFYLGLYLAEGEKKYLNNSLIIADSIIEKYKKGGLQESIDSNGLFFGGSGLSLFFTAMYKIKKEEKYKVYSKRFLQLDLNKLIESDDTYQLYNEHSKTIVPYLEDGSLGVGIAIHYYMNVIGERKELETYLIKIINVWKNRVTLTGGLFKGASGLALVMAIYKYADNSFKYIEKHFLNLLMLYTGYKHDALLFASEGNYRFSFDLATGVSGVALSLQCVKNNNPYLWLPIIEGEKIFEGISKDL